MGRSQETWNKKERERKKEKSKKEKAERKLERKENAKSGKSLDDMMAYIDENGNISSTPPDPSRKKAVKLEDIEIGVKRHEEEDPGTPREGTVTFFNEEKGYGFIKDRKTQEDFFVHVNSLEEPVKKNHRVTFEIEMGNRGPNAVNVKLIKI